MVTVVGSVTVPANNIILLAGRIVHARVVNAALEILEERQLHDRTAVGAEGGGNGCALQTAAVRPNINVVLGVRVQTVDGVEGVVGVLHRALAGSEAGRAVFDVPRGGIAHLRPVEVHFVGGHDIHNQINRVLAHRDVVQGHIIQTEVVAAIAFAGTESDVLTVSHIVGERILHEGVFIIRQIGSRNGVQNLERGRVALVGHHTQLHDHRSGGGGAAHPEGELQLVQTDALVHFRHDGDVGDVGAVIETDGVGGGVRRGSRIHLNRLGRVCGVAVPAVDVGIGAGAVSVGVEILDVRQGRDGVALGAEGDGLRPVALAVVTAQCTHAHLILRVGVQPRKCVGVAGNSAHGSPIGIGNGLVLDFAALGSVRVEPGDFAGSGIGGAHGKGVRRNAGHLVASGQTDVVDLCLQTAGRRHIRDAPVGIRIMAVFALRAVSVGVHRVELGIAVVHLAARDVVDNQQQVVVAVVVEVGVEGNIDPAVGAGGAERDRTGIDVYITVRRGRPHVLHELVVCSVCQIDVQRAGDHLTIVVLERHAAELGRNVVEVARQVNLLREGVEVMVGHREVVALRAVCGGRVAVVHRHDRSDARCGEADRHHFAEVTATAVGLHGHRVSGLLVQTGKDVVGLRGCLGKGRSGGVSHGDDVLHSLADGVGKPVQRGVRAIYIVDRQVDHG